MGGGESWDWVCLLGQRVEQGGNRPGSVTHFIKSARVGSKEPLNIYFHKEFYRKSNKHGEIRISF